LCKKATFLSSCNRPLNYSFLNAIFQIEINKNAYEKFFSFGGSNLALLFKSFPLSIVSLFANLKWKICNYSKSLLVAGIFLEQAFVGIRIDNKFMR